MKMRLLAAVATCLLASLSSTPVLARSEYPHLEALKAKARRMELTHQLAPVTETEGISEAVGKRYKITFYDPFTQKSFKSDKICLLGDEGDLSGAWVSTKNPDNSGLWVQWGHEVWIWGTDVFDLLYQVSFVGRFLKSTEITGQYTLLDFEDESAFGAFRMKKTNYGPCSDFE